MKRLSPGASWRGAAVLFLVLAGCGRTGETAFPANPNGSSGPAVGGDRSGVAGQPALPPTTGGGATPSADAGAPATPGGSTAGTGFTSGPACTTEIAGDDTTCRSAGEWKAIAAAACQAKGEVMTAYEPGGGDCGNEKTHQVKYECCPPSPPPLPPAPPPPSPPPLACFGGSDGSESSCKSPELWKQYATATCNGEGAELSDITYADDCGRGYFRYMKYVCCPPAPAFDPCAGKSCGEPCLLCPPNDKTCVETTARQTCNFVGTCSAETSMCSIGANSCPAGQTWCFFSGRCVDAHCRTCCDSGAAPGCLMPADCGPSCTKCSDGSESCAPANCGERDLGRCFYQEPKCK